MMQAHDAQISALNQPPTINVASENMSSAACTISSSYGPCLLPTACPVTSKCGHLPFFIPHPYAVPLFLPRKNRCINSMPAIEYADDSRRGRMVLCYLRFLGGLFHAFRQGRSSALHVAVRPFIREFIAAISIATFQGRITAF